MKLWQKIGSDILLLVVVVSGGTCGAGVKGCALWEGGVSACSYILFPTGGIVPIYFHTKTEGNKI